MKFILLIFFILIIQILNCQMFAQNINSDYNLDSLSDYIRTKSGNFLIGELKGSDKGKIIFDIDDIETDEIDLEDISEIIAKSTDFQVDMEDNKRVVGKIDKSNKPGCFMIYNSTDTFEYYIEDIVLLRRFESIFSDRFDGYLNISYSYNNSSGVGRLNFSNEFTYENANFYFFLPGSVSLTLDDGEKTIDQIDVILGGYYDLNENWLLLQFFEYQKINSLGIESRMISISSGGRRIVHNTFLDLNLLTGISFQKEYAINGTVGSLQAEIPLVVDFRLGISDPELTLTGLSVFYTSLSVKDRYRFDTRANLSYEFIDNFTIGTQLSLNFDSKPLDPTQKQTNIDVSVTFGIDF